MGEEKEEEQDFDDSDVEMKKVGIELKESMEEGGGLQHIECVNSGST
jgi:hypothetical protein